MRPEFHLSGDACVRSRFRQCAAAAPESAVVESAAAESAVVEPTAAEPAVVEPAPPNQQWSNQPPYGGWQPGPSGPAPLHLPQYDATIGQAASRFWRKFAVFSGRASRSEYWWWALIAFVISLVLQLVGSLVSGGGFFLDPADAGLDLRQVLLPAVPSLVWSLATLVPTLALTVRRLHDTNRSGWWYLLVLPTLVAWAAPAVRPGMLAAEQLGGGDVSGARWVR